MEATTATPDARLEAEQIASEDEERLAAEAQAQAEEQEGFEGEGDVQDDTVPQLSIPGTESGISLAIGGRAPDSSAVKIVGGRAAIEGEFKKGDVIEVIARLRVVSVEGVDRLDSDTHQISETVRVHKARIVALHRPVGD